MSAVCWQRASHVADPAPLYMCYCRLLWSPTSFWLDVAAVLFSTRTLMFWLSTRRSNGVTPKNVRPAARYKWRQNRDLRCVLHPAPQPQGAKHVSNPQKIGLLAVHTQACCVNGCHASARGSFTQVPHGHAPYLACTLFGRPCRNADCSFADAKRGCDVLFCCVVYVCAERAHLILVLLYVCSHDGCLRDTQQGSGRHSRDDSGSLCTGCWGRHQNGLGGVCRDRSFQNRFAEQGHDSGLGR